MRCFGNRLQHGVFHRGSCQAPPGGGIVHGRGGSGTSGGGSSSGGSTGGGIPGLGDKCTYNPEATIDPDTCAQYGLECTSTVSWVFCEGLDYPCPPTASYRGWSSGTCVLPPGDRSLPAVHRLSGRRATQRGGESNELVCAGDAKDGSRLRFYQCSQSSDLRQHHRDLPDGRGKQCLQLQLLRWG